VARINNGRISPSFWFDLLTHQSRKLKVTTVSPFVIDGVIDPDTVSTDGRIQRSRSSHTKDCLIDQLQF
jgi:hypothetical protein